MSDLRTAGSLTPLWKIAVVVIGAPVLVAGWDSGMVLVIVRRYPAILTDELSLYLIVKVSFVALLCVLTLVTGNMRRWGGFFETTPRYWWIMAPAWASAALSLLQGMSDVSVERLIGWMAVGLAVAIGEETVFRGIVQDILASRGVRVGIVGSAILFGLTHLIGLAAGLDWRMVLAQMVFATGLGLSFGWVRAATGSILPSIIAHAAMDGLGLAAADGVRQAMAYTDSSFAGTAAMAGFSLIWGIAMLVRPIPARETPSALV